MSVRNFTKQFSEILHLAEQARHNAYKSVNAELVNLYWQVGEYISKKVANNEWGMNVVDNLAEYLERKAPDLKGFDRRGLYRMKQFYETYSAIKTLGITSETGERTKVSAVRTQLRKGTKRTKVSAVRTQFKVTALSDIRNSMLVQLNWTNHRLILSKTIKEKITNYFC